MGSRVEQKSPDDHLRDQAAAWVVRTDRGLSPEEQDELSQWLGEDPSHGEAYRKASGHWKQLDQLGQWLPEHSSEPNPALLAPPLRRRIVRFLPSTGLLAAAAVLVACLVLFRRAPSPSDARSEAETKSAQGAISQRLEDGSIAELNRGAIVTTHFTEGERRIILKRGEAYFEVAKNPQRPFVVSANGVDVVALGTEFNVRLDSSAVEVLVTEGRVQLESTPANSASRSNAPPSHPISVLHAQERAVVPLDRRFDPVQLATLTIGEIDRVVGWHSQLLTFTAMPLSQMVAEFNRHNRTQLVIADPEIASLRISAKFKSDNVDGFVRLLETGFGIQTENRGDNEILLRRGQ